MKFGFFNFLVSGFQVSWSCSFFYLLSSILIYIYISCFLKVYCFPVCRILVFWLAAECFLAFLVFWFVFFLCGSSLIFLFCDSLESRSFGGLFSWSELQTLEFLIFCFLIFLGFLFSWCLVIGRQSPAPFFLRKVIFLFF